jgi:hypothetical protein
MRLSTIAAAHINTFQRLRALLFKCSCMSVLLYVTYAHYTQLDAFALDFSMCTTNDDTTSVNEVPIQIVPSIKNFKLEDVHTHDNIIQFAKVSIHTVYAQYFSHSVNKRCTRFTA